MTNPTRSGGGHERAKEVQDVATSIRARLTNRARDLGRPEQEVLTRFALERFLYRLSCSPHAGRFVLKGGLLLRAWAGRRAGPLATPICWASATPRSRPW